MKQAEQIFKAINRVADEALFAAATYIDTESKDITPIWTGKLREESKVVQINGKSFLRVGGRKSEEYAAYQYYGFLRHYVAGGVNAPLIQLGGFKGGPKDKSRYNKSYRYAISKNLLTKQLSGRWFERVLKNPAKRKEMNTIFKNTLMALL